MSRDEHCTHLDQEFCDCDWCRLIRPKAAPLAPLPVDVAWIDDNDGRGPVKLSNSIRCF